MFERIDIGIKTFLRDEKLFHAIQGVQSNFPGARLVIVDDGDQTEEKEGVYSDLTRDNHIIDILPFDSGFGRKSNRIIDLSTRPYLLIASDDFEFDEKAAEGLSRMLEILNFNYDISIVSGRVNNRNYEFNLEIVEYPTGISIKEKAVRGPAGLHESLWYFDCDLTVNYSLIRRDRLVVRWDDDVRIGGGEHGAFFYDCKLAGLRTVCVERVNINEQLGRDSERYKRFRNRANSPDRPCFDKREIIEYILGDGRVDYRRR